MEPAVFLATFEKYVMFYQGIFLIFLCPLLIFISQVGAAIREIAINSRKDEFSSESGYKSLDWVCYVLFFLAWISLLFGIIFILNTGWPS